MEIKVEFLSSLIVEVIDDEINELEADFRVSIKEADQEHILTIPAGFKTDFSSVPRFLFTYLVAGGRGKKAAVVHDFLYDSIAPKELQTKGRKWADEVFRAGLRAQNHNIMMRNMMYLAVRIGGAGSYEDNVPINQPEMNTNMENQ